MIDPSHHIEDQSTIQRIMVDHDPVRNLFYPISLVRPPVFVREWRNVAIGHDPGFALAPQRPDEEVRFMTHIAARPRIDIDEPFSIVDAPVIVLGGNPNFGHWWFEFMTRLAVLDRFGFLKKDGLPVYLWNSMPLRCHETLAECVPNAVISGPPALFRHAAVPSCPVGRVIVEENGQRRQAPFIWPDCGHWLRQRLRKRFGNRRVYALRDSPKRRILNEDEVRKALESRAVEILDLAPMPVIEQIQVASECSLLVMPQGAGGVLSMFTDGTVIELSNPRLAGTFGVHIWALVNGNPHHRINGTPETDAPSIDVNYTVNIDELLRAVDAADGKRMAA